MGSCCGQSSDVEIPKPLQTLKDEQKDVMNLNKRQQQKKLNPIKEQHKYIQDKQNKISHKQDPNPQSQDAKLVLKQNNNGDIHEDMITLSNLRSKQVGNKNINKRKNIAQKEDYQHNHKQANQHKIDEIKKNDKQDIMLSSICTKIDVSKIVLNQKSKPHQKNQINQKNLIQSGHAMDSKQKNNENQQGLNLTHSITKTINLKNIQWESLKGKPSQIEIDESKKQINSKLIQNEINQQQQDVCYSPTTRINVSKLNLPSINESTQQQRLSSLNQINNLQLCMQTKYNNKNQKKQPNHNSFIQQNPPLNIMIQQSRINVRTQSPNKIDPMIKTKTYGKSKIQYSQVPPSQVSLTAQTAVRR